MSRYADTVKHMRHRKQRAKDGKVNVLPVGSPKLFNLLRVGLRRSHYYILTASKKIGKTKAVLSLFVHSPMEAVFAQPALAEYRDKLTYYIIPLEYNAIEFTQYQFSRVMYMASRKEVRMDKPDLDSEFGEIDQSVFDMIEATHAYNKWFHSRININCNARSSEQIIQYLLRVAKAHCKPGVDEDDVPYFQASVNDDGEWIIDRYVPRDPDEFIVAIIDHFGLITGYRGSEKDAIRRVSIFLMKLRDIGFTVIGVQQQIEPDARAQGHDRFIPTAQRLAKDKDTAQDINTLIGIYKPWEYKVPKWLDYPIERWGDHSRFIRVMYARNGGADHDVGFFFDGKVGYLEELPSASDQTAINSVTNRVAGLSPLA